MADGSVVKVAQRGWDVTEAEISARANRAYVDNLWSQLENRLNDAFSWPAITDPIRDLKTPIAILLSAYPELRATLGERDGHLRAWISDLRQQPALFATRHPGDPRLPKVTEVCNHIADLLKAARQPRPKKPKRHNKRTKRRLTRELTKACL